MNYNNENLLGMVELYAEVMGYISSEDELSERFDTEVLPFILEAHGTYGRNIKSYEEFSNWTDMLCKEGEIHPEQYNQYCYVGELS